MKVILLRLGELWRGELPLEVAFWRYAIYYGFVINIVATAISLVLIVLDAPIAIAITVHLVPVPYLIVAARGVWRSADRHAGQGGFATFARIAVLAWCCFWFAV